MLKEKYVTIDAENRDKGRTYLIKEMPALKAERWVRHAAAAINRTDLNIREELQQLGMLGFYLCGFQALAGGEIDKIDVLMDEMLGQIWVVEDKATRPAVMEGDMWELSTIKTLRVELIELHMGFTFAELALILANSASSPTASSDTQTSPT